MLLALLWLTPSGQALFTEDFDDDTVGADPSDPGYTYSEVGDTNVDDSTSFSAPNSLGQVDSGDVVEFLVADNICVDKPQLSFRLKLNDLSGSTTRWGITDRAVSGGSIQGNAWSFMLVSSASGNWFVDADTTATADSVQIASAGDLSIGEWYNVLIEVVDCQDNPCSAPCDYTARVTISGGDLTTPITGEDTDSVGSGGPVAGSVNRIQMGDSSGTTSDAFHIDDVRLGFAGTPPRPPTGLSALVVEELEPVIDDARVELRWTLSPDDPDRDQGEFAYEVFINGVQVGTDATTSQDGDGVRFHEISIGGTAGGNFEFKVRARNLTDNTASTFSCTVSVNIDVLGGRDTCGTGAPGGGSGLDFTTPSDTAAGLAGFCADLMGDSEASKFLCGLILVVIIFLGVGAAFAAMAGAPGMPAVIAGSVGGFGMMIFLVVAEIWSLGAAAIIILLATGVALSLMRRLFFGGVNGG